MRLAAFARSVRLQLVALVVVALAPAMLLTLLTAREQRAALVERGSGQALELARAISASHGELIESARILLATLAETPAVQEHRVDECVAMAQRITQSSTSYLALAVTDPQGRSWCRYPQPEVVSDSSQRDYFKRILATDRFVMGGLVIGQVTQRRTISLAWPVHDAQNKLASVLVLGVDVDELNRRIDALGLTHDYAVTLIDRDAKVVIAWPSDSAVAIGETLPDGAFRAAAFASAETAPTPVVLAGPDGVDRLYAFRAVEHAPDHDLIIAVGLELAAALRPIDQSIALYIGFGTALILLGGVLAWWFGDQRLARPIRSLARAARQIQSGGLDQRAEATGQASEITGLVKDFNAMAATLQTQATELIAANQELERRVENRTQQLKASLEELRRSRGQLRQLSGRQRQLLEEEQTRISREVHDQLGQALTGAKMDLALIERRLRAHADQPSVQSALETARGLTGLMDDTIQIARAIARRLRPSLLDDLGLVAALDWMARDVAGRAGLETRVSADDAIGRLPDPIGTSLYRIAQEALTNVVRHAHARTVTIELRQVDEALRMIICDDGVGLTQPEATPASLGMLGMRERVEELGGTIEWAAAPDGGTCVTVTLPNPNASAGEAGASRAATAPQQGDRVL